MNTIRVSATSARNKFFDLLNQVASGTLVVIEKDKKEIAILSPRIKKTDWKGLIKASKKVHGILKNYSIEQVSPLRKRGAWKDLGNW